MSTPKKDISKAIEELQRDSRLEKDFQRRAGRHESFYQEMLAAGISRKEGYNVVATGQAHKLDAAPTIRH